MQVRGRGTGRRVTTIACDQVDPGSAKFLFIPDLTAQATGGVLAVLLVLYVGSQLLSSVLMSVTADRNQRFIMIALPFVFVPFIQGFPAGLLVYWITTNLWTVGQQYIIRRGAGLPVLGAPGSGRRLGRAAAAVARRTDEAKAEERRRTSRGQAEAAARNGDDGGPGASSASAGRARRPRRHASGARRRPEGADERGRRREHGSGGARGGGRRRWG